MTAEVFSRATLTPMPTIPRGRPGVSFEVQFNPATLRLSFTNRTDDPRQLQRQRGQSVGSEPATLSFDLEFDTAEFGVVEEGAATVRPMDVRELTAEVLRYVLPAGRNGTQAPPLLRFAWKSFTFLGTVTSVGEELDFFAADGTPLHAKVSVSMTAHDSTFEALARRQGARRAARATAAGRPGTRGVPEPDQVVTALAGESAHELAQRVGADPAAWRALMADLDDPLELRAGARVGLRAGLSATAGLTATAGFAVGAEVSAEAELAARLDMTATGTAGVGAGAAAADVGFALAAAGGVTVAALRVRTAVARAAADAQRTAFATGAAGVSAGLRTGVSLGAGASGGLRAGASAGVSARAGVTPRAGASAGVTGGVEAALGWDARAVTYGRGVPLRRRVGGR